MKIRKFLALLMAMTVACSVFAGCGDDDDDDSSSKKSKKKNDSAVSAVDDSGDGDSDAETSEKDSKDETSKEEKDSKDESSEDESSKDESSEDEKDSSEDEKDSSEGDFPTESAVDVNDISDIVGKWECDYMEFDGVKMSEFMGIPVAAVMQIELKDNGKGIVYEASKGDTEGTEFTWTAEGNKCSFEVNGQKLDFELKDSRLIAEYSEGGATEKVALKKVNKFTEFDFEAYKDSMNAAFDMSGLDLNDFNLDSFDF